LFSCKFKTQKDISYFLFYLELGMETKKIIHYSYDSFIHEIFSSRIYKNLICKFDEKFNFYHKNNLNNKTQSSFYHLILFLYNCTVDILDKIHSKNSPVDSSFNSFDELEKSKFLANQFDITDYQIECEFCTLGCTDSYLCSNLVDKTANFFVLSKKYICIMFNVLFEIDLTHVQYILGQVKINIYPFVGTTGFDLNFFLYDNIKSCNRPEVEYKGVLYTHEKIKKLSHNYKILVHNIFHDFYFSKKKIFIIPFATGPSVLNPEHWCMLFIDFYLNILFFYNSLAEQNQFCASFVETFSSHCREHGLVFRILTNKAKQQKKNKLCGLFATDFAMTMLNCEAKNREELFQKKFNIAGDFDSYIEKKQSMYIGVKDYPLKSNALYRFVQFKKFLHKMFN
jgi:hypothetical protein